MAFHVSIFKGSLQANDAAVGNEAWYQDVLLRMLSKRGVKLVEVAINRLNT